MFDSVMTQKTGAIGSPEQVANAQKSQAAAQVNKAEQVRTVDQVAKTDRASMNKSSHASERAKPATVKEAPPVEGKEQSGKVGSMMGKMLGDLEKGQGVMDKLINQAASGKQFTNAELLGLQAGMYKYTQELELTGKVVEKATSGLKDTLKTQV